MSKAFLVFSGFNQRAVITLLRKLRTNNIDFVIVAAGKDDSILNTTYRDQVVFVRNDKKLSRNAMQHLLDELRPFFTGREMLFAPTTEALNRFFLTHSDLAKSVDLTVPLVDQELYATLSDKSRFSQLCKEHSIAVPEEYAAAKDCPLPFVAKQKNYLTESSRKPILVMDESGRSDFLNNEDTDAFYFQKFISGRSLYLLAHIERCGHASVFSQENLIQQPDGKSIIAAKASEYHLTENAGAYITMLQKIGFFGLIMIEVRQYNTSYFMIEANPRLWGPSQLHADAMPDDLLDSFLRDLGFNISSRKNLLSPLYFWYEGYAETIHQGRQPTFHNYSPEQFVDDLPFFLENDLLNRPDTQHLFSQSLRKHS